MTRGVIYFLCGNWSKYIGPLVISLHSLRKWWDGPVCVMVGTDFPEDSMPVKLLNLFGWDFIRHPLAPVRRHAHYVTKASLWRHSPFDQTVLLDADTVVTGPIDDLFNAPLTVTKFAHWITTGKIIGGRLKQWEDRGIRAPLVKGLRAFSEPAINTGVVGWHCDAARETLEAWESLTLEGWQCSFTDELAMQILVAERPECIRLVDDRYNCSPVFGVNRDDARIWHYHGRRMVRRPEAGELYRPHLLAALEANVGGIADWLPEIDPPLWDLAEMRVE